MFSTKTLTKFIVSLALFMDVLDSNILNTAVPVMSNYFHVSPIDLKIALISYLLSLAIFIPTSGWTADHYGAKPVFISAFGLFTISSFFCGLSHTLNELVIARIMQGIGGAFMVSLGRLMMVRAFKKHEFVQAMNTVIMVVSLGVMTGPFIGGVIVDHLSWQWIFWVNIPTGLFAILLASYHLKETTPKNKRPFDFFGFILFGGSLATMVFSLAELSESTINQHITILRFTVSVTMFLAYIFYSKGKKYPLIQLNLLRFRTFRISVTGNLCARLGFGGVPFLLPLMQQIAFGFSAQLSGLLLLPIALGIIFAKNMSFRILKKLGYKKYLLMNTFFVGFILWTFYFVTTHTPLFVIAILTFLFGVFISAQYTGMNSLALAEIPPEALSASTSITSTVQILAQSFGVAIGAILLRLYGSRINNLFHLTQTDFHRAFFTLGIITFMSAIVFLQLRKGDGEQMLVSVTQH